MATTRNKTINSIEMTLDRPVKIRLPTTQGNDLYARTTKAKPYRDV